MRGIIIGYASTSNEALDGVPQAGNEALKGADNGRAISDIQSVVGELLRMLRSDLVELA